MNRKQKVVVGMSGGVDSSVAVYLLKEAGYDVIGITMKIWEDDNPGDASDGGCCGLSAVDDARAVANTLDIPYYVLNFKKDFREHVVDYFISEYFNGKTPNPCIACNRYIKWEKFLERALALEADFIATGHYAKIVKLGDRYTIKIADGVEKDQSYALFNLTQDQLAHTLMPIGNYSKEEIRALAQKIKLNVANKPDSQDICFIPNNDYGAFLTSNSNMKIAKGDFVDVKGNKIGEHDGIIHYTVGQRKGLGAFGKPMFVKEILPKTNTVVLGDNSDVFSRSLVCNDINMMGIAHIHDELEVFAKIRYSHTPVQATIRQADDTIHCNFKVAQRAITPGQAAVFYDSDGHILCGGTIIK